jgi:hypothetical protein
MDRPSWAPPGIDLDRPSVARVYDFFLGGYHNFAADRAVAEQYLQILPEIRPGVQANRAFLQRAVRYCLAAGVSQFLDIGSGIPTVGSVHEIAGQLDPDARVVYVDVDPVAVTHSQAILTGSDRATVILADLREPERILGDAALRGLLDLSQPVAVLMVAVLHFVPDADDPIGLIDRYRQVMASGSHLVISHASDDAELGGRTGAVGELYRRSVANVIFRERHEVEAMFSGFKLVDPGVVGLDDWHPEPADRRQITLAHAGVGRLP